MIWKSVLRKKKRFTCRFPLNKQLLKLCRFSALQKYEKKLFNEVYWILFDIQISEVVIQLDINMIFVF